MTGIKLHIDGEEVDFPEDHPTHLGYSRIAKFMECPKAYEYTYLHKRERSAPGLPLRRGTAYHNTLEVLRQHLIDKGTLKGPRTAEKLARHFSEQENLPPGQTDQVWLAVQFWHSQIYPNIDPVATEIDFEIFRGGIKITGRIDQVDRDGWVVDDKFSYDLWAEPRAKHGCQPIIYQWAALDQLEAQFGFKYRGFRYHIIKTFPSVQFQAIQIKRLNTEGSDWWEEQVKSLVAQIRAGHFPAKTSEKGCSYCDFKAICKPVIYKLGVEVSGYDDPNEEDMR